MPPNLIHLELLAPGGAVVDFMPGGDSGAALPVSPQSLIRATFDALLDPSKIQDLSGTVPARGRGVARLQWQREVGPTEIGLLSEYNPSRRADFGPAPTVTFSAPDGLPSGVTVTLVLERTRLSDKSGRPYVGVSGGSFETAPFTATVNVNDQPQTTSFTPRITFSAFVAPVMPGAVRVQRQGQDVPIKVVADVGVRAAWSVIPLGEGVSWTPGGYQLLLAPAQITDLFGTPLPPGVYSFGFTIGSVADAGDSDAPVDGATDGASTPSLSL